MSESKGHLANTVDESCRRLSVGRTMLYALIAARELRTIKVGSRTLLPESELVAFVERKLKEAA